jgi:hypothetical protein
MPTTDKAKNAKRNRRILIAAFAIFLVLAAFLAYVSYENQPHKQPAPLQPSSTYFAISGQGAEYNPIGSANASNARSVLITTVGFYFTPIGGPADNLRMFLPGFTDPTTTSWNNTIPQNATVFSGEIMPPDPIPIIKQSDGNFTLTITMLCNEANGTVVIQFTPDELVSV